MQTVEVVSDAIVGRSAIASLKGGYSIRATGDVFVSEEYDRLEVDGSQQFAGVPQALWRPAFVGAGLRIAREAESGAVSIFTRVRQEEAQDEIAKLLEAPVGEDGNVAVANDEADDEFDDRPAWQKRVDEADGIKRTKNGTPINNFGPPSGGRN